MAFSTGFQPGIGEGSVLSVMERFKHICSFFRTRLHDWRRMLNFTIQENQSSLHDRIGFSHEIKHVLRLGEGSTLVWTKSIGLGIPSSIFISLCTCVRSVSLPFVSMLSTFFSYKNDSSVVDLWQQSVCGGPGTHTDKKTFELHSPPEKKPNKFNDRRDPREHSDLALHVLGENKMKPSWSA